MKIKQDFVTNSSTCSFVVIGWELDSSRLEHFDDDDGRDIPFWSDELGVALFEGSEQGASDEGRTIVAVETISISLDEYHETDFDNLVNHDRVIEIRQKLKIGPEEKLKFITGSMMC